MGGAVMVSVCIPTYNGEKYIKEQIDSILQQLDENDEIIISDDSSTDATIDIIRAFNDPRIKLLLDNHFNSPIFNLENALKHASGDFIFLSDQDDVWKINKVSVMKRYLKQYTCVVSDAEIVNENLIVINPSYFNLRNCKKGLMRNIIRNSYIGCCMAFNRSILKYVLPFPKEIPMHDVWIGLISEKYGNSIFINDALIKYRRHGKNASQTGEKSKYSLRMKLKMRINIIIALIKR